MSSKIARLYEEKAIDPPSWLPNNLIYEARTGSYSYGIRKEGQDHDILGVCIPTKPELFLHSAGYIEGFDIPKKPFSTWQEHHVELEGVSYDLSAYAVTRYLGLLLENNPNIIDSLFVPDGCINHITQAGHLIRSKRREFLSKKAFHRFAEYAKSQMTKLTTRKPIGSRKDGVEEYGMDLKYAYHLLRLSSECIQILEDQDLHLEMNAHTLNEIRNGEWRIDQVMDEASKDMAFMEKLYISSTLRDEADREMARDILLKILEDHYGSISKYVSKTGMAEKTLSEIHSLTGRYFFEESIK